MLMLMVVLRDADDGDDYSGDGDNYGENLLSMANTHRHARAHTHTPPSLFNLHCNSAMFRFLHGHF